MDQIGQELDKNNYIGRLLQKNLKGREEKDVSRGKELLPERIFSPDANNYQNMQVMSRKISPSLTNKPKKKQMNQRWQSQEFNPSKTVQINKLKLEITDYLNKKVLASPTGSPMHETVWPYLNHTPRDQEQELHNLLNEGAYRRKKQYPQKNLYQEKK